MNIFTRNLVKRICKNALIDILGLFEWHMRLRKARKLVLRESLLGTSCQTCFWAPTQDREMKFMRIFTRNFVKSISMQKCLSIDLLGLSEGNAPTQNREIYFRQILTRNLMSTRVKMH